MATDRFSSMIERTLGATREGMCVRHPDVEIFDESRSMIKCCERCKEEEQEKAQLNEEMQDGVESKRLFDSLLSRWCQVQDSFGGIVNNDGTTATTVLIVRQMLELEHKMQQQESTIEELQKTVQKQQTCIEKDLKLILDKLETFGTTSGGRGDDGRNMMEDKDKDSDEQQKEIVIDEEFSYKMRKNRRHDLRKLSLMKQHAPGSVGIFTSIRTLEEEPAQPVPYKIHESTSDILFDASAADAEEESVNSQSSEKEIHFTAPANTDWSSSFSSMPTNELFDRKSPEQPKRRGSLKSNVRKDIPILSPQRQISLSSQQAKERFDTGESAEQPMTKQPQSQQQAPMRHTRKKMTSAPPKTAKTPRKALKKVRSQGTVKKEPSMQSLLEDEATLFNEDFQSKVFPNKPEQASDSASMPSLLPVSASKESEDDDLDEYEEELEDAYSKASANSTGGKREIFATAKQEVSSLTLDPEIEGLDTSHKTLIKVTKKRLKDKYGEEGTYTGTINKDNGVPEGQGKMEYDNVRFYEGEWKIGRWHGKGVLVNPNGDTYDGEFVYDARHGRGVYKFKNGDIYDGDFSQDKRHGKGSFIFKNGNVYKGEHFQGKFEGYGRYDFKGGYYEGEWEDGRYEGFGSLQYSDGGNYSGGFVNGIAHGQGEETFPDGTKKVGVWKKGKYQRPKSPPPS